MSATNDARMGPAEAWWTHDRIGSFDVAGIAKPQGSKSIGRNRDGTKQWIVEGKGPGRRALADWRSAVAAEARRWVEHYPPLDGPVSVLLTFRLPRLVAMPVRSYKFQTAAPDIDKLTRAVFDACTGIVWRNDAQVVEAHVIKRFADPWETPGCLIVLSRVSCS